MRPPPVYPQLWQYYFIWKEIFEEVISILKYHQNPQGTGRRKKEKKEKEKKEEEEKEKLQEKKNTSTSKSSIWWDPFSPRPSYHFKNTLQNHWGSFLNSFWTIL
jgi:hypothetical protein